MAAVPRPGIAPGAGKFSIDRSSACGAAFMGVVPWWNSKIHRLMNWARKNGKRAADPAAVNESQPSVYPWFL